MRLLAITFILTLLLAFFLTEVCVAETGYIKIENNSSDVVKVVINWKGRKDMAVLTSGARSSLVAQKTTLETIDIYRIVNSAETLIRHYAAAADCDDVRYIDVTITESGVHIDCSRICYWTYSFPVHQKFGACEERCP